MAVTAEVVHTSPNQKLKHVYELPTAILLSVVEFIVDIRNHWSSSFLWENFTELSILKHATLIAPLMCVSPYLRNLIISANVIRTSLTHAVLSEDCTNIPTLGLSMLKIISPVTRPRNWTDEDLEEEREELSLNITACLTGWTNNDIVVLDLSYSNINSQVISAIAQCCLKLEAINLAHCEAIDDTCMELLSMAACASHLRALNVTGCRYDHIGDVSLCNLSARCAALCSIKIGYASALTDEAFVALHRHKIKLEDLAIPYCEHITDSSVKLVAEPGKLRSFDISNCQKISTDGIVTLLQKSPQLRSLNLSGCDGLSALPIAQEFKHCPLLTSGVFTDCYSFSDQALGLMVDSCPNIEEFDISFQLVPSPVLSEVGLLEHIPKLRNLTRVNLSYLEHVSDAVVRDLAQNCHLLVELRLACCRFLTDNALLEIASNLKSLRVLNLNSDDLCTDVGLIAICEECELLTELDAAFLRFLTDETVTAVIKHCSCLERLSLHGCLQISKRARARVQEVWDEQAAARRGEL